MKSDKDVFESDFIAKNSNISINVTGFSGYLSVQDAI